MSANNINPNQNTPLQIETRLLDQAITLLERSVGLEVAAAAKAATPQSVWDTCRDLFFSIPGAPEGPLSERERDRQLSEYLGIPKRSFLSRASMRLNAFRRKQAQGSVNKKTKHS